MTRQSIAHLTAVTIFGIVAGLLFTNVTLRGHASMFGPADLADTDNLNNYVAVYYQRLATIQTERLECFNGPSAAGAIASRTS